MTQNFNPEQHHCYETHCICGMKTDSYEWAWDNSFQTNRIKLDDGNLEVKFHPVFSMGTAAIRGNKFMSKNRHHYWEVKMLTQIYGTDVMVGVGTKKADLLGATDNFKSLLGIDSESWGYSYKGFIQHKGLMKEYTCSFNQGNLVGVHLDTWKGELQFFLDRKPLGIAFTGLRGLDLYPMVCSTAAKSKMRITYCCSIPSSLQTNCLSIITPIQRAYFKKAFPGISYLSKSVFANILQKKNDEEEDEFEFPNDYLHLKDFDLNCRMQRKRKYADTEYFQGLQLQKLILEIN